MWKKRTYFPLSLLITFLVLFVASVAGLSEATTVEEFLKGNQGVEGLTYQVGSRSAGVREFQNLLINYGYSSIGEADGSYGNKTAAAVKEFQAKVNLPVTGKADLSTQFMLLMHCGSFIEKGETFVAQVKNYIMVIWPSKAYYIGAVDQSGNFMEGTYYYASGDYYAGEYKSNLRSGKGTAHFANGDVYIGQWKNDAMNGNGTYYYGGVKSKEYYQGNMTDNTMDGKGTYYLNGKKITGRWSKNKHVSWK